MGWQLGIAIGWDLDFVVSMFIDDIAAVDGLSFLSKMTMNALGGCERREYFIPCDRTVFCFSNIMMTNFIYHNYVM